jgi:hypothetical protein
MRSSGMGMMSRLQSLRSRQTVAAILITVLTLVVVGGLILSTTSLGCGPAQKLGLKGVLSHCKVSGQLAANQSPGTGSPGTTSTPSAPFVSPFASPSAPETPVEPGPTPPDTSPASPPFPPFSTPVSGSGGLAVPGRVLSCRLPVFVGPPGSGGFISFPGGTFNGDPTSAVTVPSPSPGGSSPAPVGPGYGYGYGYPGLSYDRAYSRWLPAPYTWVSPDGSRYAHPSSDSIYVENVATGATIELGQGHAWSIIGVSDQAVYASGVNQAGLWQLPFSGPAKQITPTGFWTQASPTAAFGGTTSAVPQGIANTIVRLDLKTGAITDWFTKQGAQSFVSGLDSHGNPLIAVSYFNVNYSETWITTGPGNASPIFNSGENLYSSGTPIADSHGVWIPVNYSVPYVQSTQGIVLYVAGSGLYWMTSLGTQIAGGCS